MQGASTDPLLTAQVRPEDVELVQRTVADVAPNVSPASPTWGEYLISLVGRFASWLGDLIGLGGPTLALVFQAFGWLLIAATAALIVVFALRLLGRRKQSNDGGPIEQLGTISGPRSSAAELQSRIEACLARGDIATALETMWTWLSLRLHAFSIDQTSWTGRELVAVARRPDLLPMIRHLERLTYGPEKAPRTDAERLWRQLVDQVRPDQAREQVSGDSP